MSAVLISERAPNQNSYRFVRWPRRRRNASRIRMSVNSSSQPSASRLLKDKILLLLYVAK